MGKHAGILVGSGLMVSGSQHGWARPHWESGLDNLARRRGRLTNRLESFDERLARGEGYACHSSHSSGRLVLSSRMACTVLALCRAGTPPFPSWTDLESLSQVLFVPPRSAHRLRGLVRDPARRMSKACVQREQDRARCITLMMTWPWQPAHHCTPCHSSRPCFVQSALISAAAPCLSPPPPPRHSAPTLLPARVSQMIVF